MKEKMITIESQLKMPMMQLPIKSVVIGIGDRTILISPIPQITKYRDQIENVGIPTDIVAPNGFHHLGIKEASRMYPSAKLWGVPILSLKRSDINWSYMLPDPWPFGETLDVLPVEGMPKIDEMIFYYRPQKVLIVSDLCFNHIHGEGFGNWIIFSLFGTYKRFAVSRFFAKFVHDRGALKKSIQKIVDLDIEQIIVPHGVDIKENAKEKLIQALKERGLI
ncbi:MAG: hypothetical protein KDD52_03940 [Bdellovibrionales bacterium]|nr:hypothetical protein [Bdellovibrionales bacterium]